LVGCELGTGSWHTITQEAIDAFAQATDDRQWIHTDPEKAKTGPYGATIAHGYLTLSLLPALTADAYSIADVGSRVNYGLDRVRFPTPVISGSRIRNQATLLSVEVLRNGVRAVIRNRVELEGSASLACVADTVTLFVSLDSV
jgi:acyl dehydratase